MYQLILTSEVERKLTEAAIWWSANRSAAQASEWLIAASEAMQSLCETPLAHPVIREQDY